MVWHTLVRNAIGWKISNMPQIYNTQLCWFFFFFCFVVQRRMEWGEWRGNVSASVRVTRTNCVCVCDLCVVRWLSTGVCAYIILSIFSFFFSSSARTLAEPSTIHKSFVVRIPLFISMIILFSPEIFDAYHFSVGLNFVYLIYLLADSHLFFRSFSEHLHCFYVFHFLGPQRKFALY